MPVETQIIELAKGLAGINEPFEHAIIVYEDGYLLHLRGSTLGVGIPLVTDHGRAVAIVHSHPVPRTAPSLPDLRVLLSMKQLGVENPKLATVYSDGREATVTVYTLRSTPPPHLIPLLEQHALEYERLNVESRFDPAISEKQLREQHALLSRLGLSIERYRFRVAS